MESIRFADDTFQTELAHRLKNFPRWRPQQGDRRNGSSGLQAEFPATRGKFSGSSPFWFNKSKA
jgi:hypothetical protein